METRRVLKVFLGILATCVLYAVQEAQIPRLDLQDPGKGFPQCGQSFAWKHISRRDDDPRLFPATDPKMFRVSRGGVRLHAQQLRNWFCVEMGRLGVQDRYVDAF